MDFLALESNVGDQVPVELQGDDPEGFHVINEDEDLVGEEPVTAQAFP